MPVYGANILPDMTGRQFGTPDLRFDAFIRNLNVSGAVSGFATGGGTASQPALTIPYSANPYFDASVSSGFQITLTGNATPVIANLISGQLIVFEIIQDAAGGHAFNWPAIVHGGVDTTLMGAGEILGQLFWYDGARLIAMTPGVITT